jgi:folate-binding protein YgfZ
MDSPLQTLPGAVPADPPDEGVAAHYGDPFREQKALAEAAGVVDRSNREVLTVAGPDRLSWLHSLTTQHLASLQPLRGAEALVLSPHGHVEHHLSLLDDGETTWLDVEPGTAAELRGYLDSMRFLLRVEVDVVTAQWAVVSLLGPDTDSALSRHFGVQVRRTPYAVQPLGDGGFARRMPGPGDDVVDLLLPRARLVDVGSVAGAAPAGSWAFEALRVAARLPRLRHETDHRTIPHEVGWLETAVHLNKGCYRGQETVARVHNLGRPPRRLVLLHLDGGAEALPRTGDLVESGGARVGFVTSAARHYELGPIALALVKRTTPDEVELTAGGMPAKIG